MRIYKIKVNGKTFEVKVMGISETEPVAVEKVASVAKAAAPVAKESAAAPAENTASQAAGSNVIAPMQGTILEVKVSVGQQVNAGDTIVILEAMKLENEIKAPVAGKVIAIKVNKGQSVNNKDVLVIIG